MYIEGCGVSSIESVVHKADMSSMASTALAVPDFERKKWCRLNFNLYVCVWHSLHRRLVGRLVWTFLRRQALSHNDCIVNFPWRVERSAFM